MPQMTGLFPRSPKALMLFPTLHLGSTNLLRNWGFIKSKTSTNLVRFTATIITLSKFFENRFSM